MPSESTITETDSTDRAMRSVGRRGCELVWSRSVVMLLLLAVWTPSSLSASCGHYVTSGSQIRVTSGSQIRSGSHAVTMPGWTMPVDRDAAGATGAGLAGQLAWAENIATEQAATGHDSACANGQCHNPCRNGQCQRAPAGLPPAPSSQINQTLQQWASLAAALVSDSPRFAFPLVIESRNVHAGYPPSIDHPPQNS